MQTFLEPTQESGCAFFMRGMTGRVVMLNLLRYRALAANAEYLAGIGHRTAALEDSRLLPLQECAW